ncbi:MAG: Do family serine endopeptidase [Gammaproteobacteria bacterium]|nr:Do family serine endopeptidase [Gammaproteobacteria bacterium]
MKRLLLFILCFGLSPLAFAALPLFLDGDKLPSLAPMLVDIQPAVVNISTTSHLQSEESPLMKDPFFRRFFNVPRQQRPESSLGSGVIVNAKKGYVVTNHHVIDKADEITVTTKDGRSLEATLVGSDEASDIAVIQVESLDLTEIKMGNSAALRVGDFVVAIGSPFGLSQTVTSGIVSALGRSGLGIEGYEDFIQTDASINPGNSGGALVNLRGELIGINTAIFSRSGGSVGIGLSIPVDMVRTLMDQLIEHGEVKRGLLGVAMQDLTPSLADAFGISGQKGAVVSQVIPGSTAQEQGIKEGDVIVGFNGKKVQSSADLRNAVGLLRAGSNAVVEFYREGKLNNVSVTIKPIEEFSRSNNGIVSRLHGARFRTIPPSADHPGGILVGTIEPNSEASASGLEEGDIIISINRERVPDLDTMKNIIKRSNDVLLIQLLRTGRALYLVIQ